MPKIKVRGKNAETAMPEYQVPFQNYLVSTADLNGNMSIDGGIGLYGTPAPTQQSVSTAAESLVNTLGPPTVPTYTMVFTSGGVGFTDSDSALTLVLTVKNLQERVNQLEAALQAYGLLS